MKNRNNTFNNAYLIQQKLEKKKKKKEKMVLIFSKIN